MSRFIRRRQLNSDVMFRLSGLRRAGCLMGLTLASCGIAKPGHGPDASSGVSRGDDANAGPPSQDAASALPDGPSLRPFDRAPIGWAAMDDQGQSGTSGGAAGPVVTAATTEDFRTYAGRAGPLVIQITGTIGDGINTELTSDKTVIGIGQRPTFHGNLDVKDAQNIIIRNLFIQGASPDGISLRRTHHVWIDHVDISDSIDGNLDITEQSDYVTVSWSRFWYRDINQVHRLSNLIGSDDSRILDAGTLRVTYHHNWWAELVAERMPRVRYGDVHLFNNYYSSAGNGYCIWAAFNARVLVESNYFTNVNIPFRHDSTGNVMERDNVYDRVTGEQPGTGVAFVPPYPYVVDAAASVPGLVSANVGPRAITGL
jgi:pectate lyase